MMILLLWTSIAHLVLSQTCDINGEINRISMREALKTEFSLGKDIDKLRTEMVENEKALKKEIADLKAALAKVKPGTSEVNMVALQDVAWQALHVSAAAACRGSTRTGGTGRLANVVLPKLHTDSCKNLCKKTKYKNCDADVSISGYHGKANAYTTPVGRYYNYGCTSPGNKNKDFDEVKADEHEIIKEPNVYYRFCCCRK